MLAGNTVSGENDRTAGIEYFESKIRPLLIERCYDCHSVESGESEGDLLIDSAAAILRGGVHGALVVPGKPERSLLMKVVGYRDRNLQMPPDAKLSEEEINSIREWIRMGAPDPRTEASGAVEREGSPLDRDPETHWAFVPPRRVAPPRAAGDRGRDPIDTFAEVVAANSGVEVNGQADDQILIRRLYFDLTGLPPTAEQANEFANSSRPNKYVRLVDQLLSTPEFGERFGRHWLDVARYADTVGYALAGRERRLTGSERYRDWVINAFCSDMPYAEMIRHQLVGERTDPKNEDGNLDAMGFLTVGRRFLSQQDVIDDRIDVITRGLLGMTVTCARCHDHKFDPILTVDYYSLGGIIFSSTVQKEGPSPLMMVDKAEPIDSPVLIRGQLGNRGPIAPRQFLTALRKEGEPRFTDGSGRAELAERIVAADNPLTARVMVNRLWGHLIGKHLVDTPSDFGFRTKAPVVPEILDNLAVEFARHQSIKRTIRRIVLSSIYRRDAGCTAEAKQVDPDNEMLARANRRRRDFESLRDSVLFVSGHLNGAIGGEPSEITIETPSPRRTVYAMIDRQNLPSLFRTFDFASPDAHTPRRYFTTVPQQALYLLNSRQMTTLARMAAQRIREGGDDQKQLARRAFLQILGRDPSARELAQTVAFLKEPMDDIRPVTDYRGLWSYGTAEIDERQKPGELIPFAKFRDDRWQVEEQFPSKGPLGYAYLSKESGHTPSDPKVAVVRRFTAPFDGTVRLSGQLGHLSQEGDGVRITIWAGDKRIFKSTQKSNRRPYGPLAHWLKAGQTVDFVASAGESASHDTFRWQVAVQMNGTDGTILETNSDKHFSGPFPKTENANMDRLAQLAQTLMLSNEFAFID